ncbi:MAG: ion channel [Candidatus Thiodiazotropha endolucinida]|nr:ion channel [Candidatus Thiodiazotropha taylori]MCW4264773.1 ion channel [Candidatus Thiodiazotropha endolucinida]
MTGSTVVEDPGIPLVSRMNGGYSKYMEEDENTSSVTTPSPTHGSLGIPSPFDNIGYKLRRRKQLINRRRVIVNIEFALALIGIIIMLIETELFFRGLTTKTEATSIILKSMISVSTILLLMAVCCYHITGVCIQMTDNSWEDWRLAMNFPWTYLKISLELLVCAIHPLPGNILIPLFGVNGSNHMVSLDSVFSILMLLRLYIVGKFTVVHSHLLTDTSTQSLGALNKVRINTVFVFKALMSTMPGSMLISLMVATLVINSWALRTCEVYYDKNSIESGYFNSMWLVAISFLTIGYGDFVPATYCGRFISVLSGLMGVGTTALLVAVLASKLEQTRPEKYVHNFVSRIKLDKIRKNAASDVIKYALQLWRMKRQGSLNANLRTHVYGKLLQAIYTMREAKTEKMTIGESAIGIIELSKGINDVIDVVENMQQEQVTLQTKVLSIEEKMTVIDRKLDRLLLDR